LILDHGDGYMTLYGHNQALHKEVGNWVEAGETIAAVGSSGDAPQAGLYFEIRHQGEPVDPLVWVGGRGRAARR
jgi:septal ring factor EnvC (AmiA/AmiB activator)